MRPYNCFPIDIMHLFHNWQGRLPESQEFSPSDTQIRTPDEELVAFRDGISGQISPKMRPLSVSSRWKAKERKDFTLLYCLILFEGYLPQRFLSGLQHFVELVDICFRPILRLSHVKEVREISARFFQHFEDCYMKHELSRASLSKYVIHLLLDLSDGILECGPLVNSSEYRVEGFIGWILDRCNARQVPGIVM